MTQQEWIKKYRHKRLRHISFANGEYVIPYNLTSWGWRFCGIKSNKKGEFLEYRDTWNSTPDVWIPLDDDPIRKSYLPDNI